MNDLTREYLKVRLMRAQEALDNQEIREVELILEEAIALLWK